VLLYHKQIYPARSDEGFYFHVHFSSGNNLMILQRLLPQFTQGTGWDLAELCIQMVSLELI
jgi:hypothetical protein